MTLPGFSHSKTQKTPARRSGLDALDNIEHRSTPERFIMKRISIILTLTALLSWTTPLASAFQDTDDNPYAPRRHQSPTWESPYVHRQPSPIDTEGRRYDRKTDRQRDEYRNDGKSQLQRDRDFDRTRRNGGK
jgi:hypothetical protein